MQDVEQRVLSAFNAAIRHDKLSEPAKAWLAQSGDFTAADFGISSLGTHEVLKKLEGEFGIEIPLEQAEKFASVKELVDYIEARQ